MQFTIKLERSKKNSEKHYLKISTYKDSIEGTFDESEIRHIIEILDNGIGSGLRDEAKI